MKKTLLFDTGKPTKHKPKIKGVKIHSLAASIPWKKIQQQNLNKPAYACMFICNPKL